MYLVDTNIISELARPRPDARVFAWLAAHDASISVITIDELSFGIARAQPVHRKRLEPWFEQLLATIGAIFDVTPAIAQAAGQLRAQRTRAGRPVAQADMLIAATATVHRLALATRNEKDFADCGLTIVNPFDD